MAENVQYFMEEMVPELEDLESKGIFSRGEIKQIVKQRENFEYRLKRRGAKKVDYLRYVEYECNIDALRIKRKSRLGIQGVIGAAEHAVTRRIHFILDRAVNKFKGDVQLWLQYIEYARTTGSRRYLGKLFAKALQLHPNSDELWTRAALFEYAERQNVQASRVLMQRALRFNPESSRLWLSYARIELQFIKDQLLMKLEKSKSNQDATSESDDGISQMGSKDLEDIVLLNNKDNSLEFPRELKEEDIASLATTPVLQTRIPRILFENAIKQLPKNVTLRLDFLHLYQEFPGTESAQEDVYENLRKEFPLAEETQLALAERHFYGISTDSDSDAVQNSLNLAEKELNNYAFHQKANNLVQLYLFLMPQHESLVLPRIEKIVKKALSGQGRFVLNENSISKLVLCNMDRNIVYDVLVKATGAYPSNISLWTSRVDALCQLHIPEAGATGNAKRPKIDVENETAISSKGRKTNSVDVISVTNTREAKEEEVYKEYIKAFQTLEKLKIESLELTSFYLHYLHWLESTSFPFSQIEAAYESSCKVKLVDTDVILESYLEYLEKAKKNVGSIQCIVDKYRKVPGRTLRFYRKAISVEKSQGSSIERLRLIFEDALSSNMKDSSIWLDFIEVEMEQKQIDRVNGLYWRAAKVVPFPDDFLLEYNSLVEKQ